MSEYIVRMQPEYPEYQILVGEIIRCKDCQNCCENAVGNTYCHKFRRMVNRMDYCSQGVRHEISTAISAFMDDEEAG